MSEVEKESLLAEEGYANPPPDDELYTPGPPPDYLTAMNMDEYGPPSYQDPGVQGIGKVDEQEPNAPTAGLPRLAYADFLPYCFKPGNSESGRLPVFDSFRGLITFANQWLEQNRHYMVMHIESIETCVGHDGLLVEDRQTIEHFGAYKNNGLLRGIRLWLSPNPDPSAPAQKLAFFNWLPKADPIEQEIYLHHGGRRRTGFTTKHTIVYPNFKDLDHTLNALNSCIAAKPIPGTVKSVQTMELMYQETWGPKCIDPDKSCYFSYAHKSKLFLQYLRVFYIIGPPTQHVIDLINFVPEVAVKRKGSIHKPRFEEFKAVFQRVSSWVYQNDAKNVRVMNIQNVEMKCDFLSMLRCVEGDVIVDPKSTWYREAGETVFVKTLRVACLRIPEPENRMPLTLTSRLFVPVRTGFKSAENIPQTVCRINAWLDLTGVPVCSVTTQKYQFEPDAPTAVKPEDTSYTQSKGRGIYMVTALRLFFAANFEEPDPSCLPPSNEFVRGSSSSCTLV